MKKILKFLIIVIILFISEFFVLLCLKTFRAPVFKLYSHVAGIATNVGIFYLIKKKFKFKIYEKKHKKIKIIKSKSNLIIICFLLLTYITNIMLLSKFNNLSIVKNFIDFSIFFCAFLIAELIYRKYFIFLKKHREKVQQFIIFLFFVISIFIVIAIFILLERSNYSPNFKENIFNISLLFDVWIFARPFYSICDFYGSLLTLPLDIIYEIKKIKIYEIKKIKEIKEKKKKLNSDKDKKNDQK